MLEPLYQWGAVGVGVDPAVYEEKARLLVPALEEMGYELVRPGGGFYVFPRTPAEDDVAFVRELARELVLTVPGTGFGRPGHFRISFCVPTERIERALPALATLAARYGLTPTPAG